MGLLDVLSTIASPVTGLIEGVAGLGSSLVNAHSQKETNRANAEINRENNAFNAEQAALNRGFQSSEAKLSRNWSTSERKAEQAWQEEMIRQQNEYNSPVNQMRMAMAAGINPASFSGSVASSASPTGSPSAPSASSPSGSAASASPAIPMQAPRYDFAPELAQSILALSQARNLDANTERTKKTLPGELKIQGMTLKLGEAKLSLTDTQEQELKSRMNVANATVRNLDQQTSNLITQNRINLLNEKEKETYLKYYEDELYNNLLLQKSKLKLDDANLKHIASQIALNVSQIGVNSALQGLYSAETQNALDVHLLNNVELNYKDKMYKLQYDKTSTDYNLLVLNNGIKERQLKFRYKDDNHIYQDVNNALDAVDLITEIAGNVFGKVPDYIKK